MSIDGSRKRPGRPFVGSTAINLRLAPDLLAKLDDWRETQDDHPTRPEAARRLIESGLDPAWAGEQPHPWGPWRYDPTRKVLVPVRAGDRLPNLEIAAPRSVNDIDRAVARLRRLGADTYLIGRFRLAAIEWPEFGGEDRYQVARGEPSLPAA